MISPIIAWAIILGGWVFPLLHILLSRNAGSWRPPEGSRCPLGPRPGWLVMVLLLGPIGYFMFWRSRRQLSAR